MGAINEYSTVASNASAAEHFNIGTELRAITASGLSNEERARFISNFAKRGGGDILGRKRTELLSQIDPDVREDFSEEFDLLVSSNREERIKGLRELKQSGDENAIGEVDQMMGNLNADERAFLFNTPEDFTTNAVLNKLGGAVSQDGNSIRVQQSGNWIMGEEEG